MINNVITTMQSYILVEEWIHRKGYHKGYLDQEEVSYDLLLL